MRRAAIWAIASLVAVGLMLAGSLGAYNGPSTFVAPSSAHFLQASANLPNVPSDVPIGVPNNELDPGFTGWTAQIIGRLAGCDTQAGGPRPTVALVQGDRFVAGQTVNVHGGFSFALPWPRQGSVLVDTVDAFSIVPSLGTARQVLLEPQHITYAVLSEPCAHAATP